MSFARAREAMVRDQVASRGVEDMRVLQAMRELPRENFVPSEMTSRAYSDGPLDIGNKQTISQPYIVGFMLEALELSGSEKVLEVGTGSGYNAALLAMLSREVWSVERVLALAHKAGVHLEKYSNLKLRIADGFLGIPEVAPFDRIVLTAAPDHVPEALFSQLAEGGILLAPEGTTRQELVKWRKSSGILKRESLIAVQFVPMLPGVSSTER